MAEELVHPVLTPVMEAAVVIDDGDMVLRRALPADGIPAIGPFVFLDHYRHVTRRGIGDRPHPHAGIEVISYLMEGEIRHRDSLGNADVIKSGEVQVIRAGRGMLHEEKPAGGRHGLQMWTSLPSHLKASAPTYSRYLADEITSVADDKATLKVICGTVNGVKGPVVLARETLLAHAIVPPGAMVTLAFDPGLEAAIYVLRGVAATDLQTLASGTLQQCGGQGAITARASGTGCEVLLFGGAHAAEPMIFAGPFVMDSEESAARARLDYLSGAMGRLGGVPF